MSSSGGEMMCCCLCEEIIPYRQIVKRFHCRGNQCTKIFHKKCLDIDDELYVQVKSSGGYWYCQECDFEILDGYEMFSHDHGFYMLKQHNIVVHIDLNNSKFTRRMSSLN